MADSGLKILKPQAGGVTELPTTSRSRKQGQDAVDAVDDLVEQTAAYGFDYRTKAEAAATASRTTMVALAIGTAVISLLLALASLIRSASPSSPPCTWRSGWPAASSTDKIDPQAE